MYLIIVNISSTSISQTFFSSVTWLLGVVFTAAAVVAFFSLTGLVMLVLVDLWPRLKRSSSDLELLGNVLWSSVKTLRGSCFEAEVMTCAQFGEQKFFTADRTLLHVFGHPGLWHFLQNKSKWMLKGFFSNYKEFWRDISVMDHLFIKKWSALSQNCNNNGKKAYFFWHLFLFFLQLFCVGTKCRKVKNKKRVEVPIYVNLYVYNC